MLSPTAQWQRTQSQDGKQISISLCTFSSTQNKQVTALFTYIRIKHTRQQRYHPLTSLLSFCFYHSHGPEKDRDPAMNHREWTSRSHYIRDLTGLWTVQRVLHLLNGSFIFAKMCLPRCSLWYCGDVHLYFARMYVCGDGDLWQRDATNRAKHSVMLPLGRNTTWCYHWGETQRDATIGAKYNAMLPLGRSTTKCYHWGETQRDAAIRAKHNVMLPLGRNTTWYYH